MEGAVAVKSDLVVKCNAETKLQNCSVVFMKTALCVLGWLPGNSSGHYMSLNW